MENWPMNISSILLDYRSEEYYIESVIVFTVLRNFSMNGTELECTNEIGSDTVKLQIDTSGIYLVSYYDNSMTFLHLVMYSIPL